MNIALIAHDQKKDDIIRFSIAYKHILQKHKLYATGTTGKLISEATGLNIHRFQSGPLGGDQQIGAMIAKNEIKQKQPHSHSAPYSFAALVTHDHHPLLL